MTPQLKYKVIALFILLDVCVVVYLFSGNPSQPVKHSKTTPLASNALRIRVEEVM